MRKLITTVLAVAGLAPLALAAPALAAPGNGAEPYVLSGCETSDPSEPPFRFCFTTRGVDHLTEKPSGDFHLIENSRTTATFTGFRVGSSTYHRHFKVIVKDGQAQVGSIHVRSVESSDGVTCTVRFRFTVLKGEVHRDVSSTSCDVSSAGT